MVQQYQVAELWNVPLEILLHSDLDWSCSSDTLSAAKSLSEAAYM
jgi:hypothetical protein